MAGRHDQPFNGCGTEDRCIVATGRTVPHPHLVDRQLLDSGQHLPRIAQQVEDAAAGEIGIEALLLDRCADQESYSSDERRVGKDCVSTCSTRWTPYY